MRIYKRGKQGIYWAQHKGERFSLGTTDRQAAELSFKEHQRRAASPSYQAAHETSLEHACREWLKAVPTLDNRKRPPSPGTIEMYGFHVGHFVRLIGAGKPLVAIVPTTIDEYISARRTELIPGKHTTRTVSASTVSKELGTLRQVLHFAARKGWHDTSLETLFPSRVPIEYEPGTRHLTLDQIPALLGALSAERAATCAFVIGLGADACAIPRARSEDFGSATVLVRGTKNSARWAKVPVVEPFTSLVEQARSYVEKHGRFTEWTNSVRDLAAACERARLPRITLRDLRRSHGMILRARGVSPHLIGAMLRHTDSRMAERVYGRTTPETLGVLVAHATTGAAGTKTVRRKTKRPASQGETEKST